MSRAREIADRDLAGNELILDADNDTSITADSDDTINFKVGGSDRLTINSSGDIDVETGDIFFSGSGKGINLGVTSNTDSNTLEDYEEGTFTPTFIGTSGSAGSHAFINTEGKYRKVGNLVYIFLFGNVTNVGSYSGNNRVGGLPFANATANIAPLVIGGDSQNASENAFTVNAGDNGGQLSDRFTQSAYAWSTIQASNSLIIAGTYPTS
tara:strand:- start:47 stop:676 length:630 start_codon:yes stop_codon:yes gene_type:complete